MSRTYTRKPNESEARERLRAFWAGSSLGRPAMHAYTFDPSHTPNPHPAGDPMSDDFDAEKYARAAVDCMRGGLFLTEAMPLFSVNPGSGVALLAHIAGAEYRYRSDSAWIDHDPTVLDREPPAWDPDSAIVRKLDACYRTTREAIGDMGFLNAPLLQDPVTTLAQMAGSEAFSMALLTDPAKVGRWLDALTDIFIHTFKRCCDISGNADSSIFWGPISEGRAEALQCDYSVMVSPAMFHEVIFPRLCRIAERMTGPTLYHLDGVAQMRFLDQIAQIPNLKGIQWNPEFDYGQPLTHIEALRKIRERGLVLHLSVDTVDDAVAVCRELGPDGVFIKFRSLFATVEEVEDAMGRLTVA